MSFRFGNKSVSKLITCDERLVRVAHRALSMSPLDFSVIAGHRTQSEQRAVFADGRSKLNWPQSKHNSKPAQAMDLAPWPLDWRAAMRFHVLAGVVFAAAGEEKVILRWGGNWDGDWSSADQSFSDLPHYELVE